MSARWGLLSLLFFSLASDWFSEEKSQKSGEFLRLRFSSLRTPATEGAALSVRSERRGQVPAGPPWKMPDAAPRSPYITSNMALNMAMRCSV